jgi:3-phosphoglycerate kinase
MLENLRYHPGETENDSTFSEQLALHAEIYINDAFGTAHRSHASNVGVPNLIGETAMGFLMEKELKYLADTTSNPPQPCAVLLGGAKVGDKIALIHHMMDRADAILVGGAMAFTFLKAQGTDVGASQVDNENLQVAEEILSKAENNNTSIVLPVDVVAAPKMSHEATWRVVNIAELEEDEAGFDIGPETSMNFDLMLSDKNTILWNGPMGVCEIPAFSTGTESIASAIRDRTEDGAISIIGGGDTASALKNIGITDGFTHVSTGGGASLQLLSGKQLPALDALHEYV